MTDFLGKRVRDVGTGFEGFADARIEHLHGCPEMKVVALVDGRIISEWIDEARLEVVERPDAAPGFGDVT